MTRPADADAGRVAYWPYPRQEFKELPESLIPLQPPKYAAGDRVVSRWGEATVIEPLAYGWRGLRAYLVKHDWADGPPTFGHEVYEDDLQPGQPRSEPEQDEPSAQTAQLEMFR